MSRTSRVELRRRYTRLLAYLAKKTDRRTGAACVAHRDIAADLGVSEGCARFTLGKLVEDGMVVMRPRYLPNGGRLENAYAITEQGAELLAALAKAAREDQARV